MARTKLVGELVDLILFLRNVNSSKQEEVVHINFFSMLYEVLFIEQENKHRGKNAARSCHGFICSEGRYLH